jgi:hypothetical protein
VLFTKGLNRRCARRRNRTAPKLIPAARRPALSPLLRRRRFRPRTPTASRSSTAPDADSGRAPAAR